MPMTRRGARGDAGIRGHGGRSRCGRPATHARHFAAAAVGCLLAATQAAAQQATVQGRVHDEEGAAVIGASVTLERDGAIVAGTPTDRLGSFRLPPVPAGPYTVHVAAIGYTEHASEVALAAGATLELEIQVGRRAVQLDAVSVEAVASRERTRFEELGGATVRELTVDELRTVPGVAEADPIRAIEVLPGVVSTSDFSAAFHVRGGSADQNLILLDGVPIFSPFHLGGLFSVFNVDMIDRVELQSGGFAAEHGGRVSSVLEIETDAGTRPFGVDSGISLLSSRAAVGGRVGGADGTLGLSSLRYRASARRSYFDVLAKPFFDFPYHLTDFQGKVEGWTGGGDRLRLTAYTGRDVLELSQVADEDFPLRLDWDWGNDLAGFRWTHPRAGGGSLDMRVNYSRFGTELLFPDFTDTQFRSFVGQGQLRVDLDTRPTPRTSVQLGTSVERLSYDNRFATGGTDFGGGRGSGWLLGNYLQARWNSPRAWLLELGARLDGWFPSPGDFTGSLSPRLALKRFFSDGDLAVKMAAGRYTQFIHSLRDEELPLGIDIWVLAGDRAPHVVSDQLQLGIEGYRDIDWFWSAEAYVRDFEGVVTFNASEDPNDDRDDILSGEGYAYGLDLLLRKETGSMTGWVALSLLKAERTFPDPNGTGVDRPNVTYSPIFDRTIDLDVVLSFPLGGWDAGVRWNLGTGTPFTRALGSYPYYSPRFVGSSRLEWSGGDDSGSIGSEYGVVLDGRNASRLPVYHRLDLSLRRRYEKSWGSLTPYVNVLNVYNQHNPLFYFFEYDVTPPTRSGVSMFPLLPTFGLEAMF